LPHQFGKRKAIQSWHVWGHEHPIFQRDSHIGHTDSGKLSATLCPALVYQLMASSDRAGHGLISSPLGQGGHHLPV
jgi:hypothetical protein